MAHALWKLDHLVLAAGDLDAAEASVSSQLGVAPSAHGRHPTMGTHNALWSLGNGSYLELVAIDPSAPHPGRPRWFGLDDPARQTRLKAGPALVAWVAEPPDVETARRAMPVDPGPLERHHRDSLHWQLTVPIDGMPPLNGALPHLIAWPSGVTAPGRVLPDLGLSLERLSLSTPDVAALSGLPLPPAVTVRAGTPGLSAEIRTKGGRSVRFEANAR